MDEEIYHSQLQLIQKLVSHLTNKDMEAGNQGKLNKTAFRYTIILKCTLLVYFYISKDHYRNISEVTLFQLLLS